MTLVKTLLSNLADAPGSPPYQIQASEGAWTAALNADSRDQHSAVLSEVRVVRSEPAKGDVRSWADSISKRVTGLLEPLKVIEVDVPAQQGLLRSASPKERDGQIPYYEMLLQGTSQATLRRYQGSHDLNQKRQAIPFALTHETLEKLVEDCTAE